MSDVMNADRYAAGIATAYGAAVQGGYTGTYAQFCAQQAQFAENAQAVEEAKQEVLSTVQTFENTTVPAAITQVQEEGTAQIQVVQDATAQQITALQEEGLRQQAAVVEAAADQVEAARTQAQRSENAADAAEGYRDETQGLKNTFENTTVPAAVQTVQNAGAAQVQAVEQAGSDQVDAVELAGSTQVGNVNTAGTTQVGNVNQAGTTQVAAVAAEGAAQVQAVEDKGDEVIASIPTEYTQLSEDVDTLKKNKAPVIVEEASGQLVSIIDGADGMLVKKLLVNVEPIQDLHGQDAPYPAGGGVNILDPNLKFQTGTQYGLTLTSADGYNFAYSGVADSSGSIRTNQITAQNAVILPAGTYISKSGTLSLYKENGSWLKNQYSGIAFTIDEPFYVQSIYWEIASGQTYNVSAFIALAKGSTAPTAWSPYSNLCPITGHTGANVYAAGINFWDEQWEVGLIDASNGQNTSSNSYSRAKNYIPIIPNTNYYFKNTPTPLYLRRYGKSKEYLGYGQVAGNGGWIAPSDTYYLRFCWDGTTYNNDISINYPSIDTSYHKGLATTIPITFPNEAGTVYGGTLDVLSGLLTGILGEVDLGTLSWNRVSYGTEYFFYANLIDGSQKDAFIGKCSSYKMTTDAAYTIDKTCRLYGSEEYGFSRVAIRDDTYTDAASFKAAMSGVQLVYELATPQTYQLTTQQMTTLLGSNNIWADTGDVEVEYCADTKLYIELLTQPTEDDMTANANIVANRFFMIGNNLYYSTSAIAAGATIIPGTNCTAISLADALNQLNT